MLLLLPTNLFPKKLITRVFMTWYLIAALLLISTFLAFYYDFMLRNLSEMQIETFDQITDHNLILGADENTKSYLIEQNQVLNRPFLFIIMYEHLILFLWNISSYQRPKFNRSSHAQILLIASIG